MKLKTFFFFSKTIDHLRHVIVFGKLKVAQKTTGAIESLQYPTTVSEIRSFLGLWNVFRRFVPKLKNLQGSPPH